MAIVYLHGFNSSPESSKAVLLVDHCAANDISCEVPTLPHMPDEAISLVQGILDEGGPHLLVGSSMGGFYATWLCENREGQSAVLINPAVRLAEKLADEVGKSQQNYHTDEEYLFTEEHARQMAALEVGAIRDPSRYTLLVQKGDELLDYAEAVRHYAGCYQIVEEGGDHNFVGFERHLARIADLARSLGAD